MRNSSKTYKTNNNKKIQETNKSSALEFFKEEMNRINKIKDISNISGKNTIADSNKPGINFDKGKLKDTSNKELFNPDQMMRKSQTKFDPKLEKKVQLNELVKSKDIQRVKNFSEKVDLNKSSGVSKTPFKPTKFTENDLKNRQIDFAPNKDLIPELGNKDFDEHFIMKSNKSKTKYPLSKNNNTLDTENILHEDKSKEPHPHGQIDMINDKNNMKRTNSKNNSVASKQNQDVAYDDEDDYGNFDLVEDKELSIPSKTNDNNKSDLKPELIKSNIQDEDKTISSSLKNKCHIDHNNNVVPLKKQSIKTNNNYEDKLIQTDFESHSISQTSKIELHNSAANTTVTYSEEVINNKGIDNRNETLQEYNKEEFELEENKIVCQYQHISIEAYK